jgi:hypothetical protein
MSRYESTPAVRWMVIGCGFRNDVFVVPFNSDGAKLDAWS